MSRIGRAIAAGSVVDNSGTDVQKPQAIIPLPGALWRDRHWRIKQLTDDDRTMPQTRNDQAFMATSVSDSPTATYTRAHEMCHAAFSPERVPALNAESYIVLEEVQIPVYMRNRLDLPPEAYAVHEAEKQRIFENLLPNVEKMTRRERALCAIAVGDEMNATDLSRIRQLMPNDKDYATLTRIMSTLRNIAASYDTFSEAEHFEHKRQAAHFDSYFTEEDEDKDGEDKSEGDEGDEGEDEEESEGGASAEAEAEEDEDEKEERKKKPRLGVPEKPAPTKPKHSEQKQVLEELKSGQGEWYPMLYETPPLSVPTRALRLLRKYVNNDTGAHIRRLDRIVSDGRVFADRRRVQGGTVLVDTSGSMAIDAEDVHILLDLAPAATVAVYGDNGHTQKDGKHAGTLRLVVNKGRMVEEKLLAVGGGNSVDGPALEWLAKQPEPRFWVSDGQVVGVHGMTTECLNFCRQVCKRNHILRLNDIPTAIAKFAKKKVDFASARRSR